MEFVPTSRGKGEKFDANIPTFVPTIGGGWGYRGVAPMYLCTGCPQKKLYVTLEGHGTPYINVSNKSKG